ncbi:MAG: ImmA/IrrE family metallo-endopeptidase [Verrucomicrobia bacterium]|nr:ImmA/IrrE family metallo-endopeptidase [Verrucomicrobiota bacterium]
MNLTRLQMEKIECQTWDLLVDVYEGKEIIPPIDINRVIKKSKLDLKMGVFKDSNIIGAYDKNNHAIYVAKGASYPRQVFTVGHELGHYYLHKEKPTEIFYFSNMLTLEEVTEEEQEAHWFSASLLMPRDSLKIIWDLTRDVTEVSRRFSVEASVAYYRLNNLGWFG